MINVAVGAVQRAWILARSEPIVIFVLMSLGNAAPVIVSYWVPLVSGPVYHASAENNWQGLLLTLITSWLIPHDPQAVAAFYEGTLADAAPIPWQVWFASVLGWTPVLLGLYMATIRMMVMVRRQWVEGERLIYPVMQLNLAMLQEDERGRTLGPFFRSGAMWIGFAVPVITGTVMGLRAYFSFLPTVDMVIPFPILSAMVSFATIGFFFLIQREVVFGLWVFTLLNKLQSSLYSSIGWGAERDPVITVWSYSSHSLVHQGMGAQVVLVLGILWVSREHLGPIFHKALTGAADVRDDDEIISYRAAVLGLVIGLGTMLLWLVDVGVPL